jgi:hypothetical protein
VRNYLANRAVDLVDPFIFEATIGSGLELHAQLTGYFGLSLGVATHQGLMLRGRYVGLGRRDDHGFLFISETAVDYRNLHPIRGEPYPRRYDHREWKGFLPSRIYDGSKDSYMPRWPDNLNVEAGLSLYFVGLHVGLNPIQLVDLLTGFFLIDIAGDDVGLARPGRFDYPSPGEYYLFTAPPPERKEDTE